MKPKILVLGLICIYLTSCATLFKGTSEEVRFSSDPQRAEVWVNGAKMGETPFSLKLESKKTYTIEFKKEGFKSKAYTISNHVGAGWIVLDVLFGLVGVIVDAATGAWYSLDQKNVDAILERQQYLEEEQVIKEPEIKKIEKKVLPIRIKEPKKEEEESIEKPEEISFKIVKKLEVVVDKSEVKLIPGRESQTVGIVQFGTTLKSIGRIGDWYKVILPSAQGGVEVMGYIHKHLVREIK